MQKLKKNSRRLLRFVVIAVILIFIPSIFLNFTYGLQYSRNKNNEFIGTHKEYAPPTTNPPPTNPPTTNHPPTTNPPTNPPTTNQPTTNPPPTNPPPTNPPATNSPPTYPMTEPTRTPENTTDLEHIGDNITPGGSYQAVTEPSGRTPENTTDLEHIDDNITPGGSYRAVTEPSDRTPENTTASEHIGGNIPQTSGAEKSNPPAGTSPKTGDDEIDPRFWLTMLAVSAFILRYLLFFRAKTEPDNEL